MQPLHKIAAYNPPVDDLKNIYILYIRSILEQSCNVWHTSLSQENTDSLERVQKSAFRIILGEKYKTYENSLKCLDLQTLQDRRDNLFEEFTVKNYKDQKFEKHFIESDKNYQSKLRKYGKFKVTHAKSDRLKLSTIVQMQYKVNELHEQGRI